MFLGWLWKMVTFFIITFYSPLPPSPGQLSVAIEGFLLLLLSMGFQGICLPREPQLSPLNWFSPFYVPSNPIPSSLHPGSPSLLCGLLGWVCGNGARGFSLSLLLLSNHQVTPPTSREQGQRKSLHAISKVFRIKVSKKGGSKILSPFYKRQFSLRGGKGRLFL